MNIKPLLISVAVLFLLFSCDNNEDKDIAENKQNSTPIKKKELATLTPVQKQTQNLLTNRVSKLGITKLSGEEISEISIEIGKNVAYTPENLLPLFSYYEFYNDNLGVHYKLDDWTSLQFYKDYEGANSIYYETNYKFYAIDESTIFRWTLASFSDNGIFNTEKLGGTIYLSTTKFTCVKGLKVRFYLEDKSTILYEIDSEFNCDLSKGFGASLDYSTLIRFENSEIRAIEIVDKRNENTITLSVDNPYMKKYFINLKKIFDKGI